MLGARIFGLAFLHSCISALADTDFAAAGVTVKVKGQSGKMTLTVPNNNSGFMDVECQFVALRQLDSDGNVLGSGGSEKHSFNSFATQDFIIGDPVAGRYESLDTTTIEFSASLVGSSLLKVETMIFRQSGSFTVGNDTVTVSAGTVKFNVLLESWSWCGGAVICKNQAGVGDSVELDISIAAVGQGNPGEAGGKYSLGGGQELSMLNTYSTDGGSTWISMPSGYPQMNGPTFTLKFPRWTSAGVIYDPIISSETAFISAAPTAAAASALLLALACFWAEV